MPQGLQNNARTTGEIGPTVQSTKLILDKDFSGKASEFVKDASADLRLCAYAWRWYPNEPETGIQKFNIEIKKAQQRGVSVRCLLNNKTMAEYFATLGFKTRFVDPTRMLHTKAILIDHKTLILGSHNYTKRAHTDNFEASIATQEMEPIYQFCEYFDRLWAASYES